MFSKLDKPTVSKNVKNLTLCSPTPGASIDLPLHSALTTPWTPLFHEALESTTDRLENTSPSSVASSGSSPKSVDLLDEDSSPSARPDMSMDEKTPRVGTFPNVNQTIPISSPLRLPLMTFSLTLSLVECQSYQSLLVKAPIPHLSRASLQLVE